jgi:hypothetical protein
VGFDFSFLIDLEIIVGDLVPELFQQDVLHVELSIPFGLKPPPVAFGVQVRLPFQFID